LIYANKMVTVITLTLFVSLFVISTAASAVEVRGSTAAVFDGAQQTWDVSNFAGFFYDIDDNLGNEQITMNIDGDSLEEDVPAGQDRGVIYRTTGQPDDFEFEDWGEYITIGFLADQYFAAYVEADNAKDDSFLYYDSEDRNLMVDEQLSRVLINEYEEYTFTTGTPLKLKEGYELSIRAIDLDGNRVYVELFKNGKSVDSAVVEPTKSYADMEDKTYTYMMNMGDTEDIVILAVHFKNAFRGAEQDLATVDGIWQISDSVTEVEEDTEYDKMTVQTVDSYDYVIEMDNEDNKIILHKNENQLLMGNIRIRTADQDDITYDDPLRFYIYKELDEPGTHEIRGPVATVVDGSTYTWDTSNFAGFFYDIDDNLGNEVLLLTTTGDSLEEDVPAGQLRGLVYATGAQMNDFEFQEWGYFNTMAFLGDHYFASYIDDKYGTSDEILDDANDSNLLSSGLLSKVLINERPNNRVLKSDESFDLKENYALRLRAGTDKKGVLIDLIKDGQVIDRMAMIPPGTYTYVADLGAAKGVPMIAVHLLEPISIGDKSYCKADGLWQISDAPIKIEEFGVYGKMKVQAINSDPENMYIIMDNEGNKITLNKNKDTSLIAGTENIRIKTADQDDITADDPLRFYVYEEVSACDEDEVM